MCYINRGKRGKKTRISKKICSPLADLLNKTVIQIKMRNERCGEKNTQLKALVILHPDTVVRGDAVMSDSYHYHCNSSEEILMGLQKQQTRCLKDSSPLNIKSLWLAIMISLYLRSLCKLGWNKFVSDQLLVDIQSVKECHDTHVDWFKWGF